MRKRPGHEPRAPGSPERSECPEPSSNGRVGRHGNPVRDLDRAVLEIVAAVQDEAATGFHRAAKMDVNAIIVGACFQIDLTTLAPPDPEADSEEMNDEEGEG